jgi:hypothetical protein
MSHSEHSGLHRSPHFGIVLLNLPWLALPAATIVRMAREHPFTERLHAEPLPR